VDEPLRIGIDFDNTIVNYDTAFAHAAHRLGLAIGTAAGKPAVRAAVRALPDGELLWQRLQADVYGAGIVTAPPFAGFGEFLERCRRRGAPVWIVSHKTVFAAADPGGVDLRVAARDWLHGRGFLAQPGPVSGVFFEPTRAHKVARIAALACTHFIDDLAAVFAERDFPARTRGVLFGPQDGESPVELAACGDWPSVARLLQLDG
jgi:hypothetical protein